MTDKILFTLQVYFDRSVAFNFSEYFSQFYTRRIELSSSFIEASSEIGRKMKSVQAKQRTCKDYVIGREKIAVNHDVAAFHFRCEIVFTTPEATVLRGFLTDL